MSTKFSEFPDGGTIGVGAKLAGLDASVSPDNRIFDFPGLGILDTNGSVLLGWSQPLTGTAVNYLEFQNALSGNPAVISALGGDIDVGLYLTTQGDGSISLVPGANGFVVAAGNTALGLPSGTTAQRPVTASGGYTRYNSDDGTLEYYSQSLLDWVTLATGSGVLSVTSADTDRITIGGTVTNPTIDIAATYVGQSSITTVGSLSSGSLAAGFTVVSGALGGTGVANTGKTLTLGGNLTTSGAFSSIFVMTGNTFVTFPEAGTLATQSEIPSSIPVPLTEGGTGASLSASNGGIFYSTGSAGAILGGTATAGQMLMSGSSAAPSWSTAVWPNTTTINRLLYSSAGNTVAEITTANSAVLVTNSSGAPSWSSTMTNGQVIIGSTGSTPVAANLTQANGVQITNGAGSITVGLPLSIPGVNLVFNGGFNVWQRGTSISPTTPITYGPDRWQVGRTTGTTGTTNFSQIYDATTNSYGIRMKRNTGDINVESIKLATSLTSDMSALTPGQVLTLSFVAAKGANFSPTSSRMRVAVVTGDTVGSDSSFLTTGWDNMLYIVDVNQVVTSTLTRYTFTTPTIGSAVTQIGVFLYFIPTGTAGADDYLDIYQLQLEISPTASNFQHVPFAQELQRCQYFYQKIGGGAVYGTSSTAAQTGVQLYQQMRVTPTVGATGVLGFSDGVASNYIQSSVSLTGYMSPIGGLVQMNNFTGVTASRPGAFNPVINGNVLTFDAELY